MSLQLLESGTGEQGVVYVRGMALGLNLIARRLCA